MAAEITVSRNSCQRHSVTETRYMLGVAQGIGDRIKFWRETRNITVPELAQAAGLKPTTIYDLERGISKSTTKLHHIAKKLQINVDFLESGKGDPLTGVPQQNESAKDDWPFTVSRARYDRLTNREKEAIDEMITAYVSHREVAREPARTTKRRVR
jgi:transcriptional regulator with XRE-family HTH domain